MRNAMGQMANNPYTQPFVNPQFVLSIQPPFYPSPVTHQSVPPTPASTTRSEPYPNPHQPGFRQMHSHAYSIAAPNEFSKRDVDSKSPSVPHEALGHRQMSSPASASSGRPPTIDAEDVKPNLSYLRQTQSAAANYPGPAFTFFRPTWSSVGPFTTGLPPESQQMLGPALDPNGPFTAALMVGSENYTSSPYYPWSRRQTSAKLNVMDNSIQPPYGGMSTTLVPGILDGSADVMPATVASSTPSLEDLKVPSAGSDFNFSHESSGRGLNPHSAPTLMRKSTGSTQGLDSGQGTPRDGSWDSFVHDGSWTEEPASTA